MIRYIPGKTRVKVEFAKNITLGDIIMFIFTYALLNLNHRIIMWVNLFSSGFSFFR